MSWLLDTNVISELRRKTPEPTVLNWIRANAGSPLYISVVTIGEIRAGIERKRLKDPVQADAIERWLGKVLESFKPRLLDVTEKIADQWGRLCPSQPIADNDAWIAATGLVHNLTVVTRNTSDFARTGVRLLNPFP